MRSQHNVQQEVSSYFLVGGLFSIIVPIFALYFYSSKIPSNFVFFLFFLIILGGIFLYLGVTMYNKSRKRERKRKDKKWRNPK
jgi:predicted ABC-type exoprotein transport system permease subunit